MTLSEEGGGEEMSRHDHIQLSHCSGGWGRHGSSRPEKHDANPALP